MSRHTEFSRGREFSPRDAWGQGSRDSDLCRSTLSSSGEGPGVSGTLISHAVSLFWRARLASGEGFSAPVVGDGSVCRGAGKDDCFGEDNDGEEATALPASGFCPSWLDVARLSSSISARDGSSEPSGTPSKPGLRLSAASVSGSDLWPSELAAPATDGSFVSLSPPDAVLKLLPA